MILDYIIIKENTIEDLEIEVNRFIGRGFKVSGGVTIGHIVLQNTVCFIYCQAMVKK